MHSWPAQSGNLLLMSPSASRDRPLFSCLMLLKCCASPISTPLALNLSHLFVHLSINRKVQVTNTACMGTEHIPLHWRAGKVNAFNLSTVLQDSAVVCSLPEYNLNKAAQYVTCKHRLKLIKSLLLFS